MGRLEDIVARNRKPPKRRERLELGLRSLFLLVILGLLIFTDWALAPEPDKKPEPPASQRKPPERGTQAPGIYLAPSSR